MKTYYKLFIQYPSPLTDDTIKEIEDYLDDQFKGKIKCDENNNQIATIIVASDSSGNPELDEVSQLILNLDGTDCGVYFGFPKEDGSNWVGKNTIEVCELLDKCEVK